MWLTKGILLLVIILTLSPVDAYFKRCFISTATTSMGSVSSTALESGGDHDLLVRTLRGEKVDRTPVWLMRQVMQL